ncbi:MAG: GntR family transcriptional regulator [Evtepia gabavorous]
MLTYSTLKTLISESTYEHLYRCIKQDILQKKLRAGEKLPSKRTFAKNLGVSTITVESAYAQLVAEGFLYTLHQAGVLVSASQAGAGGARWRRFLPGPKRSACSREPDRSRPIGPDFLAGQFRGPGPVSFSVVGKASAGCHSGGG